MSCPISAVDDVDWRLEALVTNALHAEECHCRRSTMRHAAQLGDMSDEHNDQAKRRRKQARNSLSQEPALAISRAPPCRHTLQRETNDDRIIEQSTKCHIGHQKNSGVDNRRTSTRWLQRNDRGFRRDLSCEPRSPTDLSFDFSWV